MNEKALLVSEVTPESEAAMHGLLKGWTVAKVGAEDRVPAMFQILKDANAQPNDDDAFMPLVIVFHVHGLALT